MLQPKTPQSSRERTAAFRARVNSDPIQKDRYLSKSRAQARARRQKVLHSHQLMQTYEATMLHQERLWNTTLSKSNELFKILSNTDTVESNDSASDSSSEPIQSSTPKTLAVVSPIKIARSPITRDKLLKRFPPSSTVSTPSMISSRSLRSTTKGIVKDLANKYNGMSLER